MPKFKLGLCNGELILCSGPTAGDAGSTAGAGDSAAGAAGHDGGSITLSRGAIIAIIVVASVICILGSKFSQSKIKLVYKLTSFQLPCLYFGTLQRRDRGRYARSSENPHEKSPSP